MPFGTMLPFTQSYGGENSYQNPTLSNPSKKRFTSYDRSEATGLDYAVNRFYSPKQGRFTQVDPIEMGASSLSDPQTLNLYAYCGNDPINHVDPDGLFFGFIVASLVAIGTAIVGVAKKAAKHVIASSKVGLSGPGFRTPPIFPGSLPGTGIRGSGGLGGFRTPPFVRGFLAAELIDIGPVLSIGTWDFGVGALSMLLLSGGGASDPSVTKASDKLRMDELPSPDDIYLDDCKKIGEAMGEVFKSVRRRRVELAPKSDSYLSHSKVWAEQKNILNKFWSKFKGKGCGDDDLPPGAPMAEIEFEARAKAPDVSGARDFIRRGGLIPVGIAIITAGTLAPWLIPSILSSPKPAPAH
jgi:RHS repeat-associated protein